jgi:Cu/Ag efflux pump CusA
MTSFAFILGVAPLVAASGAGAAARHSLGIGVFFGMLVSTLLGVNIIPNLFIFVRKVSERMGARRFGAPAGLPAADASSTSGGED